jgi:hypothetical protein
LAVPAIYARQKAIAAKHEVPPRRKVRSTEVRSLFMEHLILAALGAMLALYAVIIIGCLRNPEW